MGFDKVTNWDRFNLAVDTIEANTAWASPEEKAAVVGHLRSAFERETDVTRRLAMANTILDVAARATPPIFREKLKAIPWLADFFS